MTPNEDSRAGYPTPDDPSREVSGNRRSDPSLKGWYRRGTKHPPHFDGGAIVQFITFRLAGTLPQEKLARWKIDFEKGLIVEQEFHDRIEAYLDAGAGECLLRDSRIALIVQNALLHFDGKRYALHGWVIMPNHVHVVIEVGNGRRLPDILHSWKSFTAKEANKLLRRNGTFWEDDYFDRFVRDLKHFEQTLWYICRNPVKAKLCTEPDEWPWSHIAKAR